MTLQVPKVIPNDWTRLRIIVDKLKHLRMGVDASPTFTGLTLTGLTASSLLQTDANKKLESIALPLIVSKGGTGAATLTDHGILLGSGTGAVTPLGVAGSGYIPIGSAGADPVLALITGTANQIISTPGAGSITLRTPQDIHTGAIPTFAGLISTGVVRATDFAKTGWPIISGITLSFSYPTFTVIDGSSAYYYIDGVKYILGGNKTVDITDTEGLWYIYFDGATLTASQTIWSFRDEDKALVAILYWDATNNKEIFLGWEAHTFHMDGSTHARLHYAGGARWETGLLVSDAGSQIVNVSAGDIWDEDLNIAITDGAGSALFEQVLSPAELPIYYLDGASNWRIYETTDKANATDVGYVDVSNDLKYNKLNGTWANATVGLNNYVAYYAVATNEQTEPVVLIMGQRTDNKLSDAKENNIFSGLTLTGLPFQEMMVLARLILKDTGSGVYYTLEEVLDLRAYNIKGNITSPLVADHGGLAGLGDDDHTQYLLRASGLFVAVSAQTLTAGDAITATDGQVWTQIDSASAITLTSEPHIATGRNGQVIRLHNTGSYNIILQDVNNLGGSLMRFTANTITIQPAGTLELVYDSDVGFWVQTAVLNPQSFTPSISSFTANLATTREVAAASTEDSAPNFTIAYVGTPTACSIDVSAGGDPATQWPISVPSPYTALNAGTTPTTDTFYRQTSVAATRVFTATATIAGTGGLQATITYTYLNRRYCGPSSDGAALTTAEILALDDTAAGESGLSNSKYGTFTDIDTGAGEHIYYCYRSALGTVSHFSIGNEIAAFTDEGTAVTHTNDQGFQETFQQYRSDNTNFGANKDFRALSSAANNRIFCGPHTDAQIDDSGILEIDDTADGESIVSSTVARTYTDIEITGSEYLWLCHPDRVSDINTIKDGTTGFAIGGEYKNNVSHTNQYGYTETYRCWRSSQVGIYPTGENIVVT